MPRITLREAKKLLAERGQLDQDVLTADEILGIKDSATLKDTAQKHSGRVLNDLLKNSARGDTRAAIEVLDRAHGKVTQGVELTAEFTIKALHAHVLNVTNQPEQVEQTLTEALRA